MKSRLGQPDTPADLELRSNLDAPVPQNFVVVAGAGSGKTTSLVKALDHVIRSRGQRLADEGRRIACVTYTEIAAGEIARDIANSELVHVSTIHSFLWSVIHPFTNDISEWVSEHLQDSLREKAGKLTRPRTRPATRIELEGEVSRLQAYLAELKDVRRWTYGTGSNYTTGVLGHSDVIKMVPALIMAKPLLVRIVAQRFPFMFVDESQDTVAECVQAFKRIALDFPGQFCLGFFGDPMQQVYATGVGTVAPEAGWKKIEKSENYRSTSRVLDAINAIRRDGDHLVQVPGSPAVAAGMARMYVVPSDGARKERLDRLRADLAEQRRDERWRTADGVRVLVIVHRMAAKRLGFTALYEAANDDTPDSFKDGFREGDLWVLQPLKNYLLPLAEAQAAGRSKEVFSFLRQHSPMLAKQSLAEKDARHVLSELKEALKQLMAYLSPESPATIRQVLEFAVSSGLAALDSRFAGFLDQAESGQAGNSAPLSNDAASISRILACRAIEARAYRTYIEGESPYSTQHGVKGAEFPRVLVVLDDDEAKFSQYSYGKLFGLRALSDKDKSNVAEGKDNILERTRRLFYVCCSRATEDLVVVLFTEEPQQAVEAIRKVNVFPPDQVTVFDAL